jgi:transposase-like protein
MTSKTNTKEKMKITQRPSGNGKRLTPAERLAILAEKDTKQSTTAVAKKYGVHHSTVIKIWKDKKLGSQADEVRAIKEGMSSALYLTAHSSIKQVNEALDRASAKDAAVVTAIMIDKARLLDGEATSSQPVHVWLNLVNEVPVDKELNAKHKTITISPT